MKITKMWSKVADTVKYFVFKCPSQPKIRDPPPEGELFIYGVHLWGCGYEKMANLELQDIPPKSQVPVSLPLLHLSVTPRAEQQSLSAPPGESKGPYIFQCPCFVSSNTRGQNKTLFTIAVSSTDVTPQKWATRNLSCTLRPFWMFKCIVVRMYYLCSTTLNLYNDIV